MQRWVYPVFLAAVRALLCTFCLKKKGSDLRGTYTEVQRWKAKCTERVISSSITAGGEYSRAIRPARVDVMRVGVQLRQGKKKMREKKRREEKQEKEKKGEKNERNEGTGK